jgi:ATP-dependent Clp protease ATP-binding subunit ClpB
LTLDEITGVVELLAKELRERLSQQGIVLEISQEAEEFIAKEGYDPVYGARPLKRFIQQHLETPLSRKIIAGELTEGSVARVTVESGALSIR